MDSVMTFTLKFELSVVYVSVLMLKQKQTIQLQSYHKKAPKGSLNVTFH